MSTDDSETDKYEALTRREALQVGGAGAASMAAYPASHSGGDGGFLASIRDKLSGDPELVVADADGNIITEDPNEFRFDGSAVTSIEEVGHPEDTIVRITVDGGEGLWTQNDDGSVSPTTGGESVSVDELNTVQHVSPGEHNDGTRTIQDAHDALPASGGVIQLAAGEFTITDLLQFDKPLYLKGASQGTTTLKYDYANGAGTGPPDGMVFLLGDHQEVSHIQFDQNFRNSGLTTADEADVSCIKFGNTLGDTSNREDIKIHDCEFYDTQGYAIHANGIRVDEPEIRNNVVYSTYWVQGITTADAGRGPIGIENSNRGVYTENKIFYAVDDPIHLHNLSNDNIISENFAWTISGKLLIEGRGDGNTIENNRLRCRDGAMAIYLNNTDSDNGAGADNRVVGNTVTVVENQSLTGPAIRVDGAYDELTIRGNDLTSETVGNMKGIQLREKTINSTQYGQNGVYVRDNKVSGASNSFDARDTTATSGVECRGNDIVRIGNIGVNSEHKVGRNNFRGGDPALGSGSGSAKGLQYFLKEGLETFELSLSGYTGGSAADFKEDGDVAAFYVPEDAWYLGYVARINQSPDDDLVIEVRTADDAAAIDSDTAFASGTNSLAFEKSTMEGQLLTAGNTHRVTLDDAADALTVTINATITVYYIPME